MDTPAFERSRDPGAMVGAAAQIIAAIWVVGAISTSIALVGPRNLGSLGFADWAALTGAIFLPALMALFSGMAARDSAIARAEARRLAEATDRLLNPERSAEDGARALAETVRREIGSLDDAIEATLSRLNDVERQIARQGHAVNAMAERAQTGAQHLIVGMEREREDLMIIARELTNQAQSIGDSISRHTQSISQAARQAEAEVRAADQALDHRLTSFGAAAALINDRTQGLSNAAQASADSALRLESALSNALDILARATSLTDTARQSAEAAALAANSTAGALQESTDQAVEHARRAAEIIRGEAQVVEQDAAQALERLREAAEAARAAAVNAREALEDERLTRPRVRRDNHAQDDGQYDGSWRDEPDTLDAPPPPRARRNRSEERARPEPAQPQGRQDWNWRDLLSNVEEGAAPRNASPRREAEDPVAHLRRQISEPRAPAASGSPMGDLIEQAGLHIDEVFSPSGLERISQRARSGTQARRRAVRDAAPDASHRLADYLARDPHANQEAMQFLRNDGARIAELIARGRASMNAEATRIFLLIDAAAG